MLDDTYIHTSLPSNLSNLSKSSNLSTKAQDYDIISLQLTQSSKNIKKENLLHEAVIKNDINKVNSLLEANISVNSKIHLDRTPLHWAAMHSHLELIDILVTNSADLEAEDKLKMTPLLVAAWYGHVQAVEKLIAWGANVQAIDKKGETILHCASKNDHFDVIKFLLNTCLNQLNLDAQDKKLQTALHFVVMAGSDVDIINRLIESGSSLTIKDKNERTVLHYAAVKGYSDIMERLLQNKDEFNINEREIENKTALHLSASFGHKKCTALLLKNDADLYATDNEGKTALHIAASLGYTSVCDILSNSPNSPLKIRDKKGNTAVHLAVMGNHHTCIQVLIQNGAPINAMNGRQQTPLHIACEMGFRESAQILLSHGADFTISEKASGRTALYIAARGSFPAIVDMLIKADRNKQSHSLSMYSELSRKASLERNISLDSTDTHKTYLTSDSSDMGSNQLQHQLSKQQSEYSQYEIDGTTTTTTTSINLAQPKQSTATYPATGKATSHQSINSHSNSFKNKQFYNNNTKEMRDILCLVAKHYLDPTDWKKLAKLWQFTDEHIHAIEHQYTGKTSFKEHGFRMMLIWLASLPSNGQQSALKELLDGLRIIGRKDVAERIRKKIADGEFQNSTKSSEGLSKHALTSLMAEEVSEGIKLGQTIVRIVANVVGLNRDDHRRRCDCFPTSNGSCSYCSIF